MAIKTLTVTEEAYESIKRLKEETESFSNLFLRLGRRELRAKDIVGIFKHSPEESEAFRKRVREIHTRMGKGMEERMQHVRSRLKRLNRAH